MSRVDRIRWRLFKLLSRIGWRICPEPHRSMLEASMAKAEVPAWKDLP